MGMRTTLIGLAAAGLLASVGVLATATPASASNDVAIRVDPVNWTWSGTISIYSNHCTNQPKCPSLNGLEDFIPLKTQDFTVGPGGGLQDILHWTWNSLSSYVVVISNNEFNGGGVTRTGDTVKVRIFNPDFGEMFVPEATTQGPGDVNLQYNFGKPGGEYELKFYPPTGPPSLQNLNATVSAAVAGGTGCTIKGTPADDTLVGTPGDDVICGLGGNDVIHGRGGNDLIHAGNGHDTVNGGGGNDTVVGGRGRDTIHAGKGADDISGGQGKDTIHHTKGHDWVHGGPHKDKLVNLGGRS